MKNLNELSTALEIMKAAKKDFVINSAKHLHMVDGKMYIRNHDTDIGYIPMVDGKMYLRNHDSDIGYIPTDVFHEGLCDKLKIPRQYYSRMRVERPELLDASVNQWLELQNCNNLIRTYDFGNQKVARAFLSDSYKTLDNYDVLFAALDAIQSFCSRKGVNIEFEECGLTERRMYVRLTCPEVAVKATDLLRGYKNPVTQEGNPYIISGLTLTNSEVGQGAFQILPRAVILACRNGMTRKTDAFRKVHFGVKLDEEKDIVWSARTYEKNLALIVSQVQDAIEEFLSPEYLIKIVNYYTNKGHSELLHPIECMNNVSEHLGYNAYRRQNILDFFVKSKDFTKFGAVQALTFEAHELHDNDLMHEAESNALSVFEDLHKFDKKSEY